MPVHTPNILMLMVDQWRADCSGLAGHPVVETPNIDRMFADAAVFERAYAAVPSCIPARASLLTGKDQRNHGRVGYRDGIRWKYQNTLPELLTRAGYQTHCVGKMHVWPPRRRLGFESIDLHDGYLHTERDAARRYDRVDDYLPWLRQRAGADVDITATGLGCNGYTTRPWPYDEALHPNSWTVTRAVDFLRRRDTTQPFFLKVSFHRPHPPLDPPAWALAHYEGVDLPPIVEGDWVDPEQPIGSWTSDESPVPTTPRLVDAARRAYLAQLTHIDNQLNRLTHALLEHGAHANTAIVFLGDHGEQLYDHRAVGKMLPYEASARIPLMLRLPPTLGTVARRRIGEVAELRDVLPTLCDIAGTEVPDDVDGSSLVPLTQGESTWRKVLHGEHYIYSMADNHWITDGRHKYVWFSQSGREQLFDLEADPTETKDLVGASDLDPWRARLVDALNGREEGFVQGGTLQTGRVGRPVLESSGLLTDAELEAQRSETAGVQAAFDAAGRAY